MTSQRSLRFALVLAMAALLVLPLAPAATALGGSPHKPAQNAKAQSGGSTGTSHCGSGSPAGCRTTHGNARGG